MPNSIKLLIKPNHIYILDVYNLVFAQNIRARIQALVRDRDELRPTSFSTHRSRAVSKRVI